MGTSYSIMIICFWIVFACVIQSGSCQCGGSAQTVYASETPSKFESPGYPSAYTNNLNCQWLIDSGVNGQRILLYSDNVDVNCGSGDSINIYDGSSNSSSTLQSNLCGTALVSNEYRSSGRYVFIEFITDSANVGPGFEMTYVTAADTSGSGCSSQETLTATTTPQYLTSEGFPAQYAKSSSCRWLLTASNSLSTIDVEVVWSDVENDANCVYDKLVIYDGSHVCENQELLTDCTVRTSADDTPTVYTSSADSVLVSFLSDDSFNRYGFIIKYTENFVNYTTSTTSPTTTGTTAAVFQPVKSNSQTEKEINIPLMAASAVAGALFVLGILATVWFVKYMKAKKKPKKGLLTVHSIAPLPARQTVFAPRQQTNVLSFV